MLRAEIEEALEECHELEEAGALFTEDIYENAIDAFQKPSDCCEGTLPAHCSRL